MYVEQGACQSGRPPLAALRDAKINIVTAVAALWRRTGVRRNAVESALRAWVASGEECALTVPARRLA